MWLKSIVWRLKKSVNLARKSKLSGQLLFVIFEKNWQQKALNCRWLRIICKLRRSLPTWLRHVFQVMSRFCYHHLQSLPSTIISINISCNMFLACKRLRRFTQMPEIMVPTCIVFLNWSWKMIQTILLIANLIKLFKQRIWKTISNLFTKKMKKVVILWLSWKILLEVQQRFYVMMLRFKLKVKKKRLN